MTWYIKCYGLTNSVNADPAKKQLYHKSVKALHSLTCNIISLNPNINTSIHIFDHTIKPILLYLSDFWPVACLRKPLLMIYLMLT